MPKKILASCVMLCLIVVVLIWALVPTGADKSQVSTDAGVSHDPRAYSGSDDTGLASALLRDNMVSPDTATQLRFKTITTDLGHQFYLTFRQPCADMRSYLEKSGMPTPEAPVGAVQPDVAARVGWPVVEDAAGGDVRGAGGELGDARFFELTTVGNNSTDCTLYYYSTDW